MAERFPVEGLDWLLGIVPGGGVSPATLYVGLFTSQTATTVPGADAVLASGSGVTEAAGDGYARQAVAAGGWSAPEDGGTGRQVVGPEVSFGPVGSGGWGGPVNGFLLSDAATGGVAVFYANFDGAEPVDPAEGDMILVTPAWRVLP